MKSTEKMTAIERRAVVSLSSIMGLRMIGLFAVVPIFSLYAVSLPGANATLVGIALGIYGLSQALLQIPFGTLSDRYGRKPIITIGLLLFVFGSLICAFSHSIMALIIGRFLQGAGAIGSTTLAMVSDLTRENQRTKAMAIAGISIGFSFSLAMLLGPILSKWIAFNGLFLLACGFGLLAICLLFFTVPDVKETQKLPPKITISAAFRLLFERELCRLNLGIFILHAIFTASFIVIPIEFKDLLSLSAHEQWHIYVPTLLLAFCFTLLLIGRAERKQKLKFYFLLSILLIMAALCLLAFRSHSFAINVLALAGFFTGFSLLEAFLPSLISRASPANYKGTTLGIYSCAQFCGIFVGGVLGGWLYGTFGVIGIYSFGILATLLWFTLALSMQAASNISTELLHLAPSQQNTWAKWVTKLQNIPGMIEVILNTEDGIAYLKMERGTKTHPDFIRLKEQLQSE